MPSSIQDRRTEILDRLRGYVSRRVLPRLGARGEFQLVPATKGRRSIVVFLECSAGRFVLKCHDEITRAARTYFAHRHIEDRGGPIPRLLHSDFTPRTYAELGCFVLVEEAFPGKLLAEFTDRTSAIRVAAAALAQFHDLDSPGYGALLPGVRRRRGYFDAAMRRIRRRIAQLGSSARRFRPLLAPAVMNWFERFRDRIEDGSPYELTHLRMSGTNVLVSDAGEARVIDIVTARYARSGFDLTSALHRWCHDEAQRDAMLESYFAARKNLTRERFERDFAFYHAYFHFSQAHDHGETIEELTRAKQAGRPFDRTRRRAASRFAKLHIAAAYRAIRDSDVPLDGPAMKALRTTFEKPRRKKNPRKKAGPRRLGDEPDRRAVGGE